MIITDGDVTELVNRMEAAANAFIRGDIPGYLDLLDISADFTLMPPYGGPTSHGVDYTEHAMAEIRRDFSGGEATLELERSYVSGDLVVLAVIERQHGTIMGLPDQDWSLRVTLVFRRRGDRWELAHRHADPLVRGIPFDHCAALARGLDSAPPAG